VVKVFDVGGDFREKENSHNRINTSLSNV